MERFLAAEGQNTAVSFSGLTGLPCPTTGGTRSVHHLLSGHWEESLQHNPMSVPICLLMLFSLGYLTCQCLSRRRLALPNWTLHAWLALLAIAWILKLASDPKYW